MSSNPKQDAINFENALAVSLDKSLGFNEFSARADRNTPESLVPFDKAAGYIQRIVDLATVSDVASIGVGQTAYCVEYRLRGSAPGGRLVIDEDTILWPGDRMWGFREQVTVRRAKAGEGNAAPSVSVGNANLLFWTRSDARFDEADFGANEVETVLSVDLAASNFTANPTFYVGNGGVASATEALVDPIMLGAFRFAYIQIVFPGFTGGAAPGLTSAIFIYSRRDVASRIFNASLGNAAVTAASRQVATLGDGNPIYNAATGAPHSGPLLSGPVRPEYMRLRFDTSGAPTGLAGTFMLDVKGVR